MSHKIFCKMNAARETPETPGVKSPGTEARPSGFLAAAFRRAWAWTGRILTGAFAAVAATASRPGSGVGHVYGELPIAPLPDDPQVAMLKDAQKTMARADALLTRLRTPGALPK